MSAWWHACTCLWLLAQRGHGLCLCGNVKHALQGADLSSVLSENKRQTSTSQCISLSA